ncbi:MAG: class I tRNA ligase family protein [Jatrophihabitantaceae bacterium]
MTATAECSGAMVIVIPQPTVNGPLHVGHLSGPFLAADIAARAARARGERIITLAGVDVHPNFVMTKAETLGVDVYEMVSGYRAQIASAFALARISHDVFIDPELDSFCQAVTGMLDELLRRGVVRMQPMTLHRCSDCGRTMHHSYVVGKCSYCGSGANGLSCEPCGSFTSAATLVQPVCARCGGAPEPMERSVPVLRLEDFRSRLIAEWTQAELPPRVRRVLSCYLSAPLPDYPVAYPTDWGIEGSGQLAGMRVDFPTELGLSYLYGPARAVDPGAGTIAACAAAWQQLSGLWHFNGIDNAFYFGILYPAIFAAAGVPEPKMRGATVNELYLLEGQKFSTSRNHALWADEFLAEHDPELVRLYLSWCRPDRYESDFTQTSFEAFCQYVRPLLREDGVRAGGAGLPGELAAGELERAEHALRLNGFDSALAVRCLLNALAAGQGRDSAVLAALTGGAVR